MKRISETKDDLVLKVPVVVRVSDVRVQPLLAVIVPLDIEDVRVAIGVGSVQDAAPTTIP